MFDAERDSPHLSWRPGFWGWLALLALGALPPALILGLLAARDGAALPDWRFLLPQFVYWPAWAVATPLVVHLGRRFPPAPLHDTRRMAVHLLVHALAAGAMSLVLGGLYITAQLIAIDGGLPSPARLAGAARTGGSVLILFSSLIYWLLLLGSRGVDGYRRLRQREVLLAEARLAALEARIHPHFLFNALNAVSALIDEDPEAAQEMLAHLGELLRASLARDGRVQEVALAEELELLRLYLAIEQVRFGDRLVARFDVEPGLEDALVPPLLLQPLVENAVRHGISRDSTAGRLSVRAAARGTAVTPILELRVEDDGPGPGDEDVAPGVGLGLGITRARLRELYGTVARFELGRLEPKGCAAIVELPLRRSGGQRTEDRR